MRVQILVRSAILLERPPSLLRRSSSCVLQCRVDNAAGEQLSTASKRRLLRVASEERPRILRCHSTLPQDPWSLLAEGAHQPSIGGSAELLSSSIIHTWHSSMGVGAVHKVVSMKLQIAPRSARASGNVSYHLLSSSRYAAGRLHDHSAALAILLNETALGSTLFMLKPKSAAYTF